MRIVYQKAEWVLRDDLKDFRQRDPHQRIGFLRLATLDDGRESPEKDLSKPDAPQKGFLKLLNDIVTNILQDERASVYVCADQDVFIISRYLTQARIKLILTEVATRRTPTLEPASLERLALLFEIGTDWSHISALCERKQLQAEKLERAQVDPSLLAEKQRIEKKIDELLHGDLAKSIQKRRSKREKIELFVVEDDLFSQKLVINQLSRDYEVTAAETGLDAIHGYIFKAPDAILLDINLPDVSGHEVLNKIFALDPDAHIVMLSGSGNKENITKAIQRGAKGFVGKPFSRERLLHYIEKSPFVQMKRAKAGVSQTAH